MTAMKHLHVSRFAKKQRGFSLVEILVGVVIGLIGVTVMFQMMAIWGNHERSTTSGGELQTAGAIGMFSLERDLKSGGLGFSTAKSPAAGGVAGCTVNGIDNGRAFTFPLQAITIAAAPGGAPDTLTVTYGNSSFFVAQQTFKDSSAFTKKTDRRNGFKIGDLAVVADPTTLPVNCTLIEITSDANPDLYTIDHASVAYVSSYAAVGAPPVNARFNPAGGTGALYAAGHVFSLGPNPQSNVWQINAGRVLRRTDQIHNTVVDVAENVVNLKAEYGIDANGDGIIQAAEWGTVAPADPAALLAVRVAILVRGAQFEKSRDPSAAGTATAVTPVEPVWAERDAAHKFLMTNVDGTPDTFDATQADPNNWRYYRYRVYEKVIPLRNMLWGL
jgi:type IV pilus assembly protein PilW